MASPYGSGDVGVKESSPFMNGGAPAPRKRSKWLKIGLPAAIVVVVILAAVLGGVLGSRASNKNKDGSSGADPKPGSAEATSLSSERAAVGRFATATNSAFMVPLYPSTTNTAVFTTPTISSSVDGWPNDPFSPGTPSALTTRTDRPRLFAPQYKWDALPNLIQNDPYLKAWNDTIFGNATTYLSQPPVVYFMDGDSGILDNAREVKERIKAFGYAYRLTKDKKWSDRAWTELQNAAGNGDQPFGPATDRWNTNHFLDAAEFSAAFGIAYDWFYDVFSDDQKSQMRATMIQYGLQPGLTVFTGAATFGWWATGVNGNWNCVCNGGLTVAALAILGDDTTGVAQGLLGHTIDNAKDNCVKGPSTDGTWSETANYWYFGTTGHAEMASALMTATGSDYGLFDTNTNFELTGLFHMYGYGATSLFNYGDHGPNKFSTTANCMFLYADAYKRPEYALFQRDRADAAEPWSMFWYDPKTTGAYWNGAELDHFFDDANDQWASMRSSWTDINALYVAIKAGQNRDHQTHNDLDVGDFVLDALGTRWAGELGSADYRSPDYFTSGAQDAPRWKYYRKMTEGQNTILIGQANQNIQANPTVKHDSSGTKQGSSTVLDIPKDSTAFWTTDMTSAYDGASSVKRGIRLLNGRKQVLLQDEITATGAIQWRMHTNATVTTSGTSATLSLDGQTMQVSILNPPTGAAFSTSEAKRFDSDPTPPAPDQENPGVTVLIISLPAGTANLQVLFNPQWPGMSASDYVTPKQVALDDWSLTSHD
ncbi:hypothetical protein D9611_005754 [Ephemerocybe angulata]|uniref:Heparinase II/III-like C-terminal domain-containing protein n=1 Tax=Ephemerocybe angulata TaxID=980116 RepID=A0A8H5BHX8_9AGAR|nr:hypothetical protein D9611_005754 [Tulosesus angulatus]